MARKRYSDEDALKILREFVVHLHDWLDVMRYWKGDRCMSHGNQLASKHVESWAFVIFRLLTARIQILRAQTHRLWFAKQNKQTFVRGIQLRCLLISGMLILGGPAYSQDQDIKCRPTWATPDLPITENVYRYWSKARKKFVGIGPRFDALVHSWNRGEWFLIPNGYFNQWSFPERGRVPTLEEKISSLSRNSSYTGYDASTGRFNPDLLDREDAGGANIRFWMPSLRYVEQNMRTGYDFQPCEPGREPPLENEYVVMFRIIWPGNQNVEQSPRVSRFKRAQQRGQSSNPDIFDRFEDDYYVTLRCSSGGGCDGWIWDRTKNYILYISFLEALRRGDPERFWQEPTDAAIQLLESWKINEDIENGN